MADSRRAALDFDRTAGNVVQVIEIGFLVLGFAGSLLVTHSLAEEDSPEKSAAGVPSVGSGLFCCCGWRRCG